MNNIVFDLNEYPDINIDDFERHLLKYFNKYYDKLLYDKYRVYFTFHRDSENNTVGITADIQDWSCIHEAGPKLDEMIQKIVEKRQELELEEKQLRDACDRYDGLLTDISLEITGILDPELTDGIKLDTYKLKDYIKYAIVKSIKI